MIHLDARLQPADLLPACDQLWTLAAPKIQRIGQRFAHGAPSPVMTRAGRYEPQGWTEWTRGFQYGAAILAFDATGDESLLRLGREGTRHDMASHVTHFGVHDHGFNNVSTYGNLRRLILEGRLPHETKQLEYYELALMGLGLGASRPLESHARWRRLTSIHSTARTRSSAIPCAAFAPWPSATCSGTARWARTTPRSICWNASSSMPAPPPSSMCTTAKDATPTTSAAAWFTRASSTRTTAATAARARSRATRRSPRGRAGWRGSFSASPSSWSLSTH